MSSVADLCRQKIQIIKERRESGFSDLICLWDDCNGPCYHVEGQPFHSDCVRCGTRWPVSIQQYVRIHIRPQTSDV